MAPLRTLAALVVSASAASAFAPTTPLAVRTVAPVVRYEFDLLWGNDSPWKEIYFSGFAMLKVEVPWICFFRPIKFRDSAFSLRNGNGDGLQGLDALCNGQSASIHLFYFRYSSRSQQDRWKWPNW